MADGKWVMTEDDARRVDLSHEEQNITDLRKLPNYGQHRAVDDRRGDAEVKCAFCGSGDLQTDSGAAEKASDTGLSSAWPAAAPRTSCSEMSMESFSEVPEKSLAMSPFETQTRISYV